MYAEFYVLHEAPYRLAPDTFTANGLLSEPNPQKRPKAILRCGLAVEGGGAGRWECRPLELTGFIVGSSDLSKAFQVFHPTLALAPPDSTALMSGNSGSSALGHARDKFA